MDSEQGKRWWYSLKYHTVEDDDGPDPGQGPARAVSDPGSGRRALETVQERNKEWDAQD